MFNSSWGRLHKVLPRELAVQPDRRRFLLGGMAFWFTSHAASAYGQQEPAANFKMNARLVNIYATVRDRNGALVQNLGKDDFTVTEDGRKQTISFFSHENDLPLSLGLLVDTSPSEARMIDQEREASRSFLRTVLLPKKDEAFLVRFDRKVELLQEPTGSLPQLDKALDKLDSVEQEPRFEQQDSRHAQEAVEADQNRPQDADGSGTTHLFDAIYLASNQVLKNRTGRKALIVLGDGDDMGSTISQSRAIRAAQQADVTIYCIRIVDKDFGKDTHKRRFSLPVGIQGIPGIPGIPGGGPMGGPGGGGGQGPDQGGPSGGGSGRGGPSGGGAPDRSQGKKNMEALTAETGGALFEVSKKVVLSDIFAQIGRDLRSQYSLAYKPEANALPGYRLLQVSSRKKNLRVEARQGYYADSDE